MNITCGGPSFLRSVVVALAALLFGAWGDQVSADNSPSYNVRAYGAVGDGKNLDSPAINKAIEACANAGGGTVDVPAGTYLSGSIHLKSHINFHLDSGATILGAPQEMKAYDPAEPFSGPAYQDGGHTYFHNSLIWGENLVDVAITGQGTINGGGLVAQADLLDQISGFNNFGKKDAPPYKPTTLPEDSLRIGNKSISLKLCSRVLLRDVTIAHGGHFAVLATGCEELTIDNVTVDTNRDGLDIDCCRNVVVSNCRINSPDDDAICPKSTYALGRPVFTENMTITNCQVSGFQEGTYLDGTFKPSGTRNGRIKFGTEATGGFRNCTVSNCTFRACCGLALEEVDGGTMENITINNLAMMDVARSPIYITTGIRNRGPGATHPSILRHILISNVVATGIEPMSGIQITGSPECPVEDVRLDNVRLIFNGGGTRDEAVRVMPEIGTGYPDPGAFGVFPSYGLYVRHVHDLELANLRLSFVKDDLRPPAIFINVNGLEIDNLKAQTADGVIPAKFNQVKGLVIRNSPDLKHLHN